MVALAPIFRSIRALYSLIFVYLTCYNFETCKTLSGRNLGDPLHTLHADPSSPPLFPIITTFCRNSVIPYLLNSNLEPIN